MLAALGRALLAAVVGCAAFGLVATSASGAAAPPTGRLTAAAQNTFTHRLRITGWAYDPVRPRQSVMVRLYVDGDYVGRVRADDPSPRLDRKFHVAGEHRYHLTITRTKRAGRVTAKSRGARVDAPLTTLGTRAVTHYYPPPGTRIIDVAKQLVGAPYVDGGASPSGFDCSGYTKYVYAHAQVKTLVHSADGQRRSMRRIRRSRARPGDLVFYMNGGYAYHVAIYAGHGWQYAAATPKDGVRHQRVWSSNVRYGTDWH
jgi:cell wall-associated NlpC family hydrolase